MLQADQDGDAATQQGRFQSYVKEVIEYLQFKQMPLPPRCTLTALIHAEGLASTKPNAAGLFAEPEVAGTIASINLSDADSYLVFSNRRDLQDDYPLVRLTLQPGEGFWLPKTPIAHDGDTRGRSEIDVQLVLHACLDRPASQSRISRPCPATSITVWQLSRQNIVSVESKLPFSKYLLPGAPPPQ